MTLANWPTLRDAAVPIKVQVIAETALACVDLEWSLRNEELNLRISPLAQFVPHLWSFVRVRSGGGPERGKSYCA